MSINVSQTTNDFNKVKMENYEKAGNVVAQNFSNAEETLMKAYTVSGNDIKTLAQSLGIETSNYSDNEKLLNAVQSVAQYKYERASRIYSMFTKIMENAHQMLMQIINKIG